MVITMPRKRWKMLIKFLVDEDVVNYKKTSMFIGFPYCTFKCGKENCQNYNLQFTGNIEVEGRELVHRYITNPLTSAIVIGGLEPFDSWEELQCLIMELRYRTSDDIVIYSGYTDDEIPEEIHKWLSIYAQDGPIIVKYGRYLPNQNSIFNEDLLQMDLQRIYAIGFFTEKLLQRSSSNRL